LRQSIYRAIIKEFKILDFNDPLKYLSKAFNRHSYILVTNYDKASYIKYYVAIDKDLLSYFRDNFEN